VTGAFPAGGAFSVADRVSLRAGPLTLEFDRGTLRWIRCGSREVLRGIYVAVRDPQWTTVPGTLSALAVESGAEAFRARFRSSHREGPIHYEWEGALEGDASGTVRFAMEGEARSTFLKNRIGLCVLHPVAECAGRPCEVERADGEVVRGVFPRFISPHQPFLGIRAIRHEVVPGLVAELRFLGDVFEMEDQRNWSDASFKTYSTPLALPYPAEIRAGTRVQQSVTLRLIGEARPRPVLVSGTDSVRLRVDLDQSLPRPRLGLGASTAGRALTAVEGSRLRTLSLDHLRVDLHLSEPGVEGELGRAVQDSRALDVPLEVALFLSDDTERDLLALALVARRQQPRVGIWLLFRQATATTTDGLVAQARRWLLPIDPHARFGGGTDLNFAELNRGRPSAAELDQVSFSLNPQVHAFDDATLVENLASLQSLADSARAFVGSCPLALSPVTLRPRARRPAPGSIESADPRQTSALGAVWTAGLLAAGMEAGFASLTLFEPVGPSGLLEGETVHPLFHVLEAWAAMKGGVGMRVTSEDPQRVRGLAFRNGPDVRVLVFNMGPERVRVHVGGLPLGARATKLQPVGSGGVEPAVHTSEGYGLALDAYEILWVEARA
jgi:D-apionolactonase